MKLKIANCITFLLVLFFNTLAATSGINDYSTGQISGMYPTLFTPAGFTFSIWSVIYLLLIGFCFAQFNASEKYIQKLGWRFISLNLLNILWLFMWHHLLLLPAVIVMILLLINLLLIYSRIENVKVSKGKLWFLKTPFSIYLGWISVALIANTAVYLSTIGLSPENTGLTITMIAVAAILAMVIGGLKKDIFYSFTIIWALFGVASRFWNSTDYQNLVITAGVGIILICVFLLVKRPAYLAKFTG